MLPATVLGREEGIFEDVLEHAGEVSERVLLSVVEQVGWADVRRQLARHTSAIQGIVRTRNCEFARVVHLSLIHI